jgi:hypothetical protein
MNCWDRYEYLKLISLHKFNWLTRFDSSDTISNVVRRFFSRSASFDGGNSRYFLLAYPQHCCYEPDLGYDDSEVFAGDSVLDTVNSGVMVWTHTCVRLQYRQTWLQLCERYESCATQHFVSWISGKGLVKMHTRGISQRTQGKSLQS